MSISCDQISQRLAQIESNLSLLDTRIDELVELIGQYGKPPTRKNVLDWVLGDIKNQGAIGLAVLGSFGIAIQKSPEIARQRASLEKLFKQDNDIRDVALRADKNAFDARGRANALASQVDKTREIANGARKVASEAEIEAKIAQLTGKKAQNTGQEAIKRVATKADAKQVNGRFSRIGKQINRFNVDLGQLSKRVIGNTRIGKAALNTANSARKLYQRIPGPLRKALSVGARALGIATNILSILETFATQAIINKLQQQIAFLQKDIASTDQVITRLTTQVLRNRTKAEANESRTEINQGAIEFVKSASEREDKRLSNLIQDYFRATSTAIQSTNKVALENRNRINQVRQDLTRRIREEVAGLTQQIAKVISNQGAIRQDISGSQQRINAHTTNEVAGIQPAITSIRNSLQSQLNSIKQAIDGQLGRQFPQTQSALKGVEAGLQNDIRGVEGRLQAALNSGLKELQGNLDIDVDTKAIAAAVSVAVLAGIRPLLSRLSGLPSQMSRLTTNVGQALKNQQGMTTRLNDLLKRPSPNLKPTNDALKRIQKGVTENSEKLGPQIKSKFGKKIGIAGRLSNMWRTSLVSQVLNALNTVLLLHNAMMLSRNLLESAGDFMSLTIQVIQRKFFGVDPDETPPIDVNELVGQGFNGLMNDLLGEELWQQVLIKINSWSRIVTAASNVIYSVRNMFDGVTGAIETAANNTGRIGNALLNSRVVQQCSYSFMPTNTRAQTGRGAGLFNFINNATEIPDLGSTVMGEIIGVDDEAREMGTNFGNLQNAAEQERVQKQQEDQAARQASRGSDLSLLDFLPGGEE